MKTSFVLAALLAASPLAATGDVTVAPFAPGETLVPPALSSPQTESRTLVRTVVPVAGRAVVDVPSTGTGTLLVWVLPSRGDGPAALRVGGAPEVRELETRLVTPTGRVLEADDDGARGDTLRRYRIDGFGVEELGLPLGERQEALRVLGAEPGLHRVEVSAPDGGAVTVAAVELESPLVLTTWATPLSRQADEPVTVHARLSDGDAPLAGAVLSTRLAPSGAAATDAVTLFDDGLHGDGAAGDGHYAAAIGDVALPPGLVAVRVEASGTDARGRAFARTGAAGFVSERGGARLLPGSVRAEWTGEADARVLRVAARAWVREAGDYRLDVLAGGEALPDGSRPGLAWAERTDELASGSRELAVDLPASLLGDGPLHLDVRLLGLTSPGVAGRVTLDVEP